MKYILDNDEYKKSGKQFRNDKEKLFYTLWKKRDPTPNTEYNELMDEYYKRVVKNKNYWKANESILMGFMYYSPFMDRVWETDQIVEYFDKTQVYTVENINNEIWIGSKFGLFIYIFK